MATRLGVYFLHGQRSCLHGFSENLRLCGAVGVLVYLPPGVLALGQRWVGQGMVGPGWSGVFWHELSHRFRSRPTLTNLMNLSS